MHDLRTDVPAGLPAQALAGLRAECDQEAQDIRLAEAEGQRHRLGALPPEALLEAAGLRRRAQPSRRGQAMQQLEAEAHRAR